MLIRDMLNSLMRPVVHTEMTDEDYIREAIQRTTGPGDTRINPYRLKNYMYTMHTYEATPPFWVIKEYCFTHYGINAAYVDPSLQTGRPGAPAQTREKPERSEAQRQHITQLNKKNVKRGITVAPYRLGLHNNESEEEQEEREEAGA